MFFFFTVSISYLSRSSLREPRLGFNSPARNLGICLALDTCGGAVPCRHASPSPRSQLDLTALVSLPPLFSTIPSLPSSNPCRPASVATGQYRSTLTPARMAGKARSGQAGWRLASLPPSNAGIRHPDPSTPPRPLDFAYLDRQNRRAAIGRKPFGQPSRPPCTSHWSPTATPQS
jgi:hypothetical protein